MPPRFVLLFIDIMILVDWYSCVFRSLFFEKSSKQGITASTLSELCVVFSKNVWGILSAAP